MTHFKIPQNGIHLLAYLLDVSDYRNMPAGNSNLSIGYVYIVRPIECNVYKIGATVDLQSRLDRLQRHKKCKFEYVFFSLQQNYFKVEASLLETYKDYCLSGDWFAFTDEQVISIALSLKESDYGTR